MLNEFIAFLEHMPWVFYGFSFYIGCCIFSFLNVVVYRLPIMMEREWTRDASEFLGQPAPPLEKLTLSYPESHCPECKTLIKPIHLIPAVGWLITKGKCAACGTKISAHYPLVEVAGGILFALLAYIYGPTLHLLVIATLLATLFAAAKIDHNHQLLPDNLTFGMLWLSLAYSLSYSWNDMAISPASAICGAAIGYLALWLPKWTYQQLKGIDGMGGGDLKLLAAFGAFAGAESIPVILLTASVSTLLYAIATQNPKDKPMAFGPHLSAGFIAALIVQQYQSVILTAWLTR